MMVDQIQELIDAYLVWLKEKTRLREVAGWVEITTPYLDRHNDFIQIYASKDDGRFVLTDDSYTIEDLRLSGCDLNTPKRQSLLRTTLNGFGVQLEQDALVTHATERDFAYKKHNLVQAILAVNDLFYLAPATVRSIFLEDVREWLLLSDIRSVERVKFTGRSSYDHLFDFVIPSSRDAPQRIVQAINRPNRDNAQSIAFAWFDTRDARSEESRAYAILNDSDHAPPSEVIDALTHYDVRPVLWSEREAVRRELAA